MVVENQWRPKLSRLGWVPAHDHHRSRSEEQNSSRCRNLECVKVLMWVEDTDLVMSLVLVKLKVCALIQLPSELDFSFQRD